MQELGVLENCGRLLVGVDECILLKCCLVGIPKIGDEEVRKKNDRGNNIQAYIQREQFS